MKKITFELSDEAYEMLTGAVDEMYENLGEENLGVKGWLESELNDNTETIIEMLLADY